MEYKTQNGVHVVEVPVSDFAIKLVDRKKKACGENVANAGFFSTYAEEGELFTLPAGHLVADFEATGTWTRFYCDERGLFEGDKYTFDSGKWRYGNHLHGKAVSTLVIKDGQASIQDLVELPVCDYAVAGVPIMRDGEDVKFATYVTGQGWDGSTLYATWHTFVGLKDDPGKVYVLAMKTTTSNMVLSAEAFRKFKAMGFKDVIKLDGGGSFYLNAGGQTTATSEDRRICSIIKFKDSEKDVTPTMFKIALGAGHGIGTAGKRCHKSLDPNETREWWLNDRVCDHIEWYLKDYDGYSLLRLDDSDDGKEDVALAERVQAANDWDADFYLSVHHNALGRVFDGGGIVAFAHPQAGAETFQWLEELYDALIEHTGLKGNRANPKATADFYVLRMTKMSAVLLELGFMDSKTDVPIILTDEYAQACARAIVEVLVRRGKLKKKATQTGGLYKVQVGAFSQKANAEQLVRELKAKGYPAIIIKA